MSNIPPAPEPYGSQPAYESPAASSQPPAPAYAPGAYPAASAAGEPGVKPKGPSTLGIIAFVAALAGVIIGSILVFVGGQAIGSVVQYTGTSGTVDPSTVPAAGQDAATSGGGLTVAGFLVFGVLALWGFIQGIVATVKKRGRGWGIAAIILAVIGGGIVAALWFAGLAAGAAPYVNG
jgi:hypothetical protein